MQCDATSALSSLCQAAGCSTGKWSMLWSDQRMGLTAGREHCCGKDALPYRDKLSFNLCSAAYSGVQTLTRTCTNTHVSIHVEYHSNITFADLYQEESYINRTIHYGFCRKVRLFLAKTKCSMVIALGSSCLMQYNSHPTE